MAGKARDMDKRPDEAPPAVTGGRGQTASAERAAEGRRSATIDLPFVTAQFRAPELRVPTREDLDTAARSARSMLPSGRSALFYGGLAVTAVVGIIEWPVAVAVGVGTALASQGAANPTPGGAAARPDEGTTAGTGGAGHRTD